jgi:hypothetical protein
MIAKGASFILARHPGEGRDLDLAFNRAGAIPAFAGMSIQANTHADQSA